MEEQFAVLLKIFQEVVKLYFSDVTPFANAQTLQWISAQFVPPVPPFQRTFDIDSRQSSP
ncbi:type VI secretion system domain-containing protein [Pseudomonas syringae group genomosp. 7]|uniref:type VI secretion system domain-containing protein n=1 Tax=Pseudomonas syringae group genomosp. 7 TaxID=251699 RepID=UPI00376F8746